MILHFVFNVQYCFVCLYPVSRLCSLFCMLSAFCEYNSVDLFLRKWKRNIIWSSKLVLHRRARWIRRRHWTPASSTSSSNTCFSSSASCWRVSSSWLRRWHAGLCHRRPMVAYPPSVLAVLWLGPAIRCTAWRPAASISRIICSSIRSSSNSSSECPIPVSFPRQYRTSSSSLRNISIAPITMASMLW